MESDDDGDIALCCDAYDVVHVVHTSGSLRRSACSLWNQNITGNGLCWGTSLPHKHPTCVYCIHYEEHDRRLCRVLRAMREQIDVTSWVVQR